MKKLTALLLGAAMAFSLAACSGTDSSSSESTAPESSSAAEDTSSEASSEEASSTASAETASYDVETVEDGVLIMSTNAAFPPYEMTNDAGEFEGIDVEMAGEIAKRLGLELQIDDMDFDAALLAVQQGKSDIAMAGITITEDRLVNMDFSNTYANGVQSVIVPEGSDITSPDDLAGKLVGVQRGTTGYTFCIDEFGEDAVAPFDNGNTAVQNLVSGKVDAVVIDNAPAQEYVAANPGLTILDTAFADEDYAIGVAKGNTQLLDAINSILAEMEADGTTQAIIDKYISAE
ncbi:MAG TPA: ABC transporter substrate-binding protein [Candidatus Gemmiger stercorigallinarum]|nr:ABC transporter substrate-binding protein [Candidatus Gemmiger stercorigallinarum]